MYGQNAAVEPVSPNIGHTITARLQDLHSRISRLRTHSDRVGDIFFGPTPQKLNDPNRDERINPPPTVMGSLTELENILADLERSLNRFTDAT